MKRATMILVACALVLLAVLSITAMLHQLTASAEHEVVRSLQQTLSQTGRILSEHMRAVSSLTQMIGYDERLQTAIQRAPENETLQNQLKDVTALRDMIDPVLSRTDVSNVRCYLSERLLISRDRVNFFAMSELESLQERERILAERRGNGTWIVEDAGATMTHSRVIRSLNDYDQIGAYILVSMRTSRVLEAMTPVAESWADGRLVLLGEAGQWIAAGEAPTQAVLSAMADAAPGDSAAIELDGRDAVLLKEDLTEAGWSLCLLLPRADLLADHGVLRSAMMLMTALLVLLLVIVTLLIAYSLYTQGVRQYLRRLNRALATHGIARYRVSGIRDDFKLAESIDGLMLTLNQLTEEAFEARLREREAVLRALQAQINPHFLYNTLDMIHWKAVRSGADDVCTMIETLAQYFRLSLSGGSDIVKLSVEIDIVRSYLALQAERFDHSFQTRCSVPEDAAACLLPKLTLQPLVENALLHGIRMRRARDGGLITISASLSGEHLTIQVRDNGPGIEAGGGQPRSAEPGHGFGLQNVRERIELFSGGDSEIRMENDPDGGARVTLWFLTRT